VRERGIKGRRANRDVDSDLKITAEENQKTPLRKHASGVGNGTADLGIGGRQIMLFWV